MSSAGTLDSSKLPSGLGIGGSEDVTHLPKDDARAAATYHTLQPGAKYVDPGGQLRVKPISTAEDYAKIPDGATYADPTGKIRVKPQQQGVGFAAQTLFDMSQNNQERLNALARTYGKQNVKQDPKTGEFSVNYQGKTLKPGHGKGLTRPIASALADVLPVGGSALGGFFGVPSSIGAMAIAGAGGAAGQAGNDALLRAAGVYSRSAGEEAKSVVGAGLGGGAGEGLGRFVGAAVPFVKKAVEPYIAGDQHALASFVSNLLGVSPEVKAAQRLTSQGIKVRPSAYIKEAPMIVKEVEQFGPAFYPDPFRASAEKHYETQAGRLLGELGVPLKEGEKLTEATAKPSSEKAGQAMIDRVKSDVARTDAALEHEMAASKAATQASYVGKESERLAQINTLTKVAAEAQAAAKNAIDSGFKDIEKDIAEFNTKSANNPNSGQLWQHITDKIIAANKAMKETAGRLYYRPAEEVGKTVQPDVSGLKATAEAVRNSFPAGFSNVYPGIFNTLKGIETGKASLAQLHELSQEIASKTNWSPINATAQDGLYKHFVSQIKDLIMKPVKGNVAWEKAAGLIKDGDAFYAANRPKFDDAVIKHIVSGSEAGLPPNASELASVVFKEENASRIAEMQKLVGPEIWPAVEAAHVQQLFDASKGIDGKVDLKAFVNKVVGSLNRSGLKQLGGSKLTDKVVLQAQRAAMMSGDLSVQHMPGDTVATYLKRVADVNDRLETLAKQNPLGELQAATRDLDQKFRVQKADILRARRQDPLSLLYKAAPMAEKSADAILDNPDLLRAASAKFGPESTEWELLRQVGAKRLLQREVESTGKLRSELGKSMSEETQKLLFPGTSLKDLHQLVSDMELLMGDAGAGMAGSLAAQSRVLHPATALIGESGKYLPGFVTGGPVGRMILGSWYKLLTTAVTSPKTLNFLAKGLSSADPADRTAARALVKKWANIGGATGAALGEDATQNNGPQQ